MTVETISVTRTAQGHRPLEQCACCGTFSVATPATSFGWPAERCPVCGWVTDFLQEHDPQLRRGRNPLSLNEARSAYVRAS